MSGRRSIGLFASARVFDLDGEALDAAARAGGVDLERIVLPGDPDARLDPETCARVEVAYFSDDVFPDQSRAFFAASLAAENLRWLQIFNAGFDHPVFQRFLERGVRMTNAAGASGVPIAQSAIAGLLMLARGFPAWLEAQSRRAWETRGDDEGPTELAEQTLVVLGLGGIGREVARLGQALGLKVIGVRRRPLEPGDPVDECVTPDRLAQVLPRADWLAITCPLTEETHGLIDAEALAALPRGAHLLNVARGEIVDETALIDALRKQDLAGAYLDVFETEPLPETSPLWDLPRVIITPHNSGASRGNEARRRAVFVANFERWCRGEPLLNEVS